MDFAMSRGFCLVLCLWCVSVWMGLATTSPTIGPTRVPTVSPTVSPTVVPTRVPTVVPTVVPTISPTRVPTLSPTNTASPTTSVPTRTPTFAPSQTPTIVPTATPTVYTASPSFSRTPTLVPTQSPTKVPTVTPTRSPTTRVPTLFPTYTPTFEPTSIPTASSPPTAESISAITTIAQHQLVVVNAGSDALIKMKFYDTSSTNYKFAIEDLPNSGSLYQLSQVFSNYGYEPKKGTLIDTSAGEVFVTGSQQRVYYTRPQPDRITNQKWGSFNIVGVRSKDGNRTEVGTITLVPPSGAIVGSDFLFNDESWTITGNKASRQAVAYERYSRGPLINFYVTGSDDVINVDNAGAFDRSLWYFEAPSKFFGNQGISYGGTLSFNIAAFSGDFNALNDLKTNVVLLECETCVGPVGKGITLGYSMSQLVRSPNGKFTGEPMRISIALNEHGGWLKDSQDVLVPWTQPSQCDIIQVLSRLSKIRILGDWTTWYETVAIDNVQIANTKAQLPLCSMVTPDASVCIC